MPLLLPKQRGQLRESNYTGRPSSTWGTVVTSHSVAHQFPSTFTQLIASTLFDSDWVNILFHTNSTAATDTDSLVTIYVGAGGSEQVLIPNLLAGWTGGFPASDPSNKVYSFPLRIPAGSRLSARHRSVRTSTGVTLMIELLGGGQGQHWVGNAVECLGANEATSGGTFITPGGAAEGTFTNIGTPGHDYGFVQPIIGGNTDTTMNSGTIAADLGVTGVALAGLDDFLWTTNSNEFTGVTFGPGGRFCFIPSGVDLELRAQTSATAEAGDWCVYGVY